MKTYIIGDKRLFHQLFTSSTKPKVLSCHDCHDTHHNDTHQNGIRHNDTQHKGVICQYKCSIRDTQHNNAMPLCCVLFLFIIMLNMLNVIILSVVKLNVVAPYSQHFTSFVNYEWAQEARVLNYTWLERLSRDKHSSLLGPFIKWCLHI